MFFRKRIVFSAVFALTFAVSLYGETFTLVRQKKANSWIQCNPVATPQEFEAAMLLQTYLRKISGAYVDRRTYPSPLWHIRATSPDMVEILPVTLENGRKLLPPAVVGKLESTNNREAFFIQTENGVRGRRIFIAGKTPIAVLYGVQSFIEDDLGVRFFYAGELGEYCPKKDTVAVPDISRFSQPWMESRSINHWTKSVLPLKEDEFKTWMTRRAMCWNVNHCYSNKDRKYLDWAACGNSAIGGGGHLTFEQAVPKTLFKSHPEYFPLKKGVRVCEERSQRCLSNPDVVRMVVDYIVWHTSCYNASFSISYHDSTDGWCMCPGCVKMGTGDTTGKFSYSTLAHRFTAKIASEVHKRNPDAVIQYDMYSQFRPLPDIKGLHYNKNMVGTYCPHQRCYVHAFNDRNSDCNKMFRDQLEQWRKLGTKIGFFEYYCAAKLPYCPIEFIMAKDMKYFHSIGMAAWIEDSTATEYPYLLSNWQFYYAASKLMWDASLDIDKLMDDAYTYYYGKASVPMKKYHAYRRELWEAAPGHALYGGPKRFAYCLLVPGAEKRLTGFLAEAKNLAKGDAKLLKRIAIDEEYLKKYWIAGAAELKKFSSGQLSIPASAKNGAVKIDGVLNEDAWRGAQFVTGFLSTQNKGQPAEETRVRILFDRDAWYIGIEAMTEHAWSKLHADAGKRDGELWKDDSMEIFFQLPASGDYYQLIVNSVGALYDGRNTDISHDSKAEIGTKVLKDRYVIEMRVPVAPMGRKSLSAGEPWKMHFYRNCQNLQPPASSQSMSLDGTGPKDQTRYRSVVTGKNVFTNGDFSMTAPVNPREKKNYSSSLFPKHWGGGNLGMEKKNGRNVVKIKHYMITFCDFTPAKNYPQVLKGSVVASGKGKLTMRLSGCKRIGDTANKPFGHEIQIPLLTDVQLTDKAETYTFECVIPEGFQSYIYVFSNDAVVESINGTLSKK